MSDKVGEIEGYDVLYIPEKDIIFCKNTSIKFPVIEKIVTGSLSKDSIPEKKLTITKDDKTVYLGCLTTTINNCLTIQKNVRKLKRKKFCS